MLTLNLFEDILLDLGQEQKNIRTVSTKAGRKAGMDIYVTRTFTFGTVNHNVN